MPIIETRGALSSRGYGQFAQGAAAPPTAGAFIEDVFSTWLYAGNGSTQTITNGIDLATKGGLVWIKSRSDTNAHGLWDTSRGAGTSSTDNKALSSNLTNAQGLGALTHFVSSFNSTGFGVNVGASAAVGFRMANQNGVNYASWTFAKQPKFFDVVTYTGNGASLRAISHSLGSAPGCIIIKGTSSATNWRVYHRSLGISQQVVLNATDDAASSGNLFGNPATAPTDTNFYVGNDSESNGNGQTYVAYLFAHNAGGFGLTGTDNVISCGSYVGNGSAAGPTVTLGYEPQWMMIKAATRTGNWMIVDSMRGLTTNSSTPKAPSLSANSSAAEYAAGDAVGISSTGFQIRNASDTDANANGQTYIYIAIRRGPMRTPTSGTSVFAPLSRAGTGASATITGANFPVDLAIGKDISFSDYPQWANRLTGNTYLRSSNTDAQATGDLQTNPWDTMDGLKVAAGGGWNSSGSTYINYFLRRAPGFFDVVCYTGTGVARTVSHNLGVVPEMMIVKRRDSTGEWKVYTQTTGNGNELVLNSIGSSSATDAWNDTTPTASVFSIGFPIEGVSQTFVAYLFATLSGVSKVGTYTGTGSTVQVDCGFTAGARFVLIKRTDATGDWYVWDSARGIVPGNDPYLRLNSIAAEVTSTDWVDTLAAGFEVSNAGGNLVNVNGASYIFLSVS